MRKWLSGLTVALLSPPVLAQTSPYAPMAYLTGHCWAGTLKGSSDVDTHCFSWVYDGKFVRDRHTVHGQGHPDHMGESLYYWDETARRLQYLYIESDGGYSKGEVQVSGEALVFPETRFQQGGQLQAYRSRWSRSGEDAYDVVTEFRKKEGWVPGWTVHMQKRVDAPEAGRSS